MALLSTETAKTNKMSVVAIRFTVTFGKQTDVLKYYEKKGKGKWTAFVWRFSSLFTSKRFDNTSQHSHTHSWWLLHKVPTCSSGTCTHTNGKAIRSNLEFSILPISTSICGLEEPGIEPSASLRLLLLSQRRLVSRACKLPPSEWNTNLLFPKCC